MANIACQAVCRWLDSERKKPLLVYGELQSGKKFLLRLVLRERGYQVHEPDVDNMAAFGDSGLFGKNAFIMRVEELGFALLPNVKKAPVIYVCHKPYGLLTKAELLTRFELLEIKTGRRFGKKGFDAQDDFPTFWATTDKIRERIQRGPKEKRSALEIKIDHVMASGDYFPTVINNSYISETNTETDLFTRKMMARSAEAFSQADLLDTLEPSQRYHLAESSRILKTIVPVLSSNITSRSLVMKKPAEKKEFSEKNTIMSYGVVFPKNSYPIHIEDHQKGPPPPVQKKRAARQPKKTKAPKIPKTNDKAFVL
jgi:hypothetical protein